MDTADILDDQKQKYLDGLIKTIKTNLVKPKVTIVGRSDTGKSTLINSLLGEDKMPTSWTPTTAIAVYIKHMEDKPDFMEQDVWVFANHHEGETLWDASRFCDEEYCRAWKIAGGDIGILHSFGTRQGGGQFTEAGSAVVFVDAPILQVCDIVDLPGFGTELESDDLITFRTARCADVIIYLSHASQFMQIADINYLNQNIQGLPVWEKSVNQLEPLANLFVVASQAQSVNHGNPTELRKILRSGSERLAQTFPDHYWAKRQAASGFPEEWYADALPQRFFTYTTDIPDLCEKFNAELKSCLETLPYIVTKQAKEAIRAYAEKRKPNLQNEILRYEGIINERNKYVELLKEIDANEDERKRKDSEAQGRVQDEIKRLSAAAREEFIQYCSETVNVDAIMEQLKSKGIKNKKEDIELFTTQYQNSIQQRCDAILAEKSEDITKTIHEYIANFSSGIYAGASDEGAVHVDFDAFWAFASALGKIGLWGGIGGTVAGIGAMAFGFAVLNALGDVAFAAGGFSIIAGPIACVAGLGIIAVLGTVKLFGGGWEKSVAKKFVKAFEEKNIQNIYLTSIQTYWNQTSTAFTQAAAQMDAEWNTYVEKLRKSVEEKDLDKLNREISSLRALSDFFENIPL